MITKDISPQPTNISRCPAASNGMRILMLSTDSNIFEKDSAVRARMIEYGTLCDELHIIILNQNEKRKTQHVCQQDRNNDSKFKISENTFVYPTNSIVKILMPFDAIKIGKKITNINLVTAQDPFETGFAGWWIALSLGAKLQLQIHTDFMSHYFRNQNIKNRIRVWFAKFLLPKADCVRVVSERIKESIVSFVNAPISILPIFTDIKNIQNKPITADLHKKYPQFEKIILMVSRLEPEKNVYLAIKVFARIVKKYPKAGLIIVGDGKEKERLMFHVSRFKIRDSVVFEGWKKDVTSYYKTADVFLQTSNYEGYGLSFLEAFLSSATIVTTDVGIAGDIVRGVNVFVCPVMDAECILEKLGQALALEIQNKKLSMLSSVIRDKSEYFSSIQRQWIMCGTSNIHP